MQEAHHRIQIRNDLLQFLEEHGKLPCLSLEDNIVLIKKEEELSQDNKKLSQKLETANQNVEKLGQHNDELMEQNRILEATLAKIL